MTAEPWLLYFTLAPGDLFHKTFSWVTGGRGIVELRESGVVGIIG